MALTSTHSFTMIRYIVSTLLALRQAWISRRGQAIGVPAIHYTFPGLRYTSNAAGDLKTLTDGGREFKEDANRAIALEVIFEQAALLERRPIGLRDRTGRRALAVHL